ncbi:MAG: sigma-70 family RNA polymerase sigma factor [Candidatus Nanopelagicales bacterium]
MGEQRVRRLESLFREHHGALSRYVRRRVPLDDVNDVVAEVFVTAVSKSDQIPEHAVLPWLYRTAHHHVAHRHRTQYRRDNLVDRLAAQPVAIEHSHSEMVESALDASAMVHAALATLSTSDAELLRLSAWEQLTTLEISYVLSCRESTVRVRLSRARSRMAKAVKALERPGELLDHRPGDQLDEMEQAR